MTKRIAVYGTLKRGFYNYNRFNSCFPFNFIYSEVIKGFSLYDLGSYPTAIENENDKITIEIFEVSDECFNILNRMELFAGYVKKEVETSVGSATMWVMEAQNFPKERYTKIDSGNYSNQ